MRADLVPDDLWERVAPLLPPAPERRLRCPGRLRVPDRAALAGIMCVLRTGVAWRDVPSEAVGCSGVTAWRRLRDWTEADVWPRLHTALLTELRRADLVDLDGCAVDCSHVRALKGGIMSAPRPSTAPASAPSAHVIVDRCGTPRAVTLTGNRNDVTQLLPLLDAIPPIRGLRLRCRPRRLFADRG
ncbi:IS5 family transposase [Streptomyces sp. NPDC014983]|uniref:IS5 family transposase n=1 Tax=Streptomyces sp. NPDC014983 TaxID=3364933 RepID=UPI0037014351